MRPRAWAQRFFAQRNRMPNDIHAADYSAVTHWLRAMQKAGTDEALAVLAAMRAMPVRDVFTDDGVVRADNKMVFSRYLMRVKTPAASKAPWDYLDLISKDSGRSGVPAAWRKRLPARQGVTSFAYGLATVPAVR